VWSHSSPLAPQPTRRPAKWTAWSLAAAAGGIIFFVMYLPYAFTVLWEEKMLGIVKTLVVLIIAFQFNKKVLMQSFLNSVSSRTLHLVMAARTCRSSKRLELVPTGPTTTKAPCSMTR